MLNTRKKVLLLGTLGGSWAIIPELLGFTNHEDIKLFAERQNLANITGDLPLVEEIWLVTTNGKLANLAVEHLRNWQKLLGRKSPSIRIWSPAGVDDLTSQNDIRAMQELTWRLALRATEERGAENVCYCLAGGRKTMSSDLQQAASLFGGHRLLHLIDAGNLPEILLKPIPENLAKPLAPSNSMLFSTVTVDRELPRAELLDFLGEKDGLAITHNRFSVPMAPIEGTQFQVSCSPDLSETIEERRTRAKYMLFHYAQSLSERANGTPFQALYVLPPILIQKLKTEYIGQLSASDKVDQEIAWLRKLPKTDLHCHLGGIADASDLLEIAGAMSEDLEKYQLKLASCIKEWQKNIDKGSTAAIREELVKNGEKRLKETFVRIAQTTESPVWAVCACFISMFKNRSDLLDKFIFEKWQTPSEYIEIGINDYEPLGDLQGSSLLQTESAIRAVCRLLIKKCCRENVKYIEVRCSPVNYTRGGLDESDVVRFIQQELGKSQTQVRASLIFIGSRHGKMSDCCRHVELAQNVLKSEHDNYGVPLVGFDLAGDEKFDAEAFAPAFKPLFERCLHITVHAGETRSADSIWKAVYALNAERIGHGLKLGERNDLMMHFLDRGICVEMCPSSNCQIVGFRDNFLPSTHERPNYPLATYLASGLKVSVNTDNPGISRTNQTFELHRAARMSEGGLSRWDILQLVKNGFRSSFARYDLRKDLLLQSEKDVLKLLRDESSQKKQQ